MSKRYLFYVKVIEGWHAQTEIDKFKKVIEDQRFFNPGDKILYIPADETRLEEVYPWEVDVKISDPGPGVA